MLLAAIWQVYATMLANPLLFPKFSETLAAFYENIMNGVLLQRGWFSIKVLLMGYVAGMLLASILTALAITSRIGNDFLETLTAMFNPLPAIALLPLALIWFGLGNGSLVFVLIHSVLWPVALNTHSGFLSVSPTMRMVGRNYGLSGPRYVMQNSDTRRVSEHSHRHENRLGVCMVYSDCSGVGIRRFIGIRRARLVYL